ncbi:hypothetical protein KUTeg_017325, partial [Tegillarca granosa]
MMFYTINLFHVLYPWVLTFNLISRPTVVVLTQMHLSLRFHVIIVLFFQTVRTAVFVSKIFIYL